MHHGAGARRRAVRAGAAPISQDLFFKNLAEKNKTKP